MRIYLTYKERVENLKRVAETIETIEKISVTKLRNTKAEFEQMQSYLAELEVSLVQLGSVMEKTSYNQRSGKNAVEVMVVLTGDKGLVGTLYQDILSLASQSMSGKALITIGAKANLLSGNKMYSSDFPASVLGSEVLGNTLSGIEKLLLDRRLKKLDVVYPSFGGFIRQTAKISTIYPIDFSLLEQNLGTSIVKPKMLLVEPGFRQTLKSLVGIYINSFVIKAFAETALSEIAARLINSQKASDKAQALIKRSIHEYQKIRKGEITSQQLENFVGHINLT